MGREPGPRTKCGAPALVLGAARVAAADRPQAEWGRTAADAAGCTVPGVLRERVVRSVAKLGRRAEGLLERVLFAFPDEAPFAHWSERGLPDELKVGWADAIERLRGPLPHESGAPAKRLIELAADALAEWVPWHDDQADALNLPGADAVVRGAEGSSAIRRAALILHGLDVACHPTRGPGEPPPPVSRSAVLRNSAMHILPRPAAPPCAGG